MTRSRNFVTLVLQLFDFYSTIDLNNVFWTSQVGYKKLYTHLGLPDSRIKQVTLQTIFKQVSVYQKSVAHASAKC